MKKELPFPNRKLERSAIKHVNDEYYLVLRNKIKIFNSYKNIKVLYEARYEALCMYNGCEGTKAGEKFWSLVVKAEKAILRVM